MTGYGAHSRWSVQQTFRGLIFGRIARWLLQGQISIRRGQSLTIDCLCEGAGAWLSRFWPDRSAAPDLDPQGAHPGEMPAQRRDAFM